MWPFGYHSRYPYTDFHELNADWILDKIRGLEEAMRKFIVDTEVSIVNTVNKWLDDHPEATTTVQDGSLTFKKLVNGTLGFVTPEMFGAKGDGATDDTQAINDAVNSGFKRIEFSNTTYLVSKMPDSAAYPDQDQPCISIYDKDGLVLNGNGAILKCNNHGQGIIEVNNSRNVTVSNFELAGYGSFPPISADGRGEKGSSSSGYYHAGYDWESHKNNSVNTSGFTGVNGDPTAPWGVFGNGYIGNVGIGLLIENGCDSINVYDVVSHGFNYSGISVGFRGHENYPISKNISINNCTCYNMYDNGINIFLSDNVNVDKNKIYDIGHPSARPANATTPASYTILDPGYGITLRKPNNATSKANNTTISNNFITKCVRKGVDSHASNNTIVDGNNISLCYVAGIESANGTAEETWTTNMKVVNNLLTHCGAYGNAISVHTVTDGSADIAPTNYPFNIDIVDNTLKECACATNGIIYVRCGKGITVGGNLISGSWAIRTMTALVGIRIGQSEMQTNGVNVKGNKINLDDIAYLIQCTDLHNAAVSGNTGYVTTCNGVLVVTGDCIIADNDLRAGTYQNAPSLAANTGKTLNNILAGSTRGFKILSGTYAITSGYVIIADSMLNANSIVLVQQVYDNAQSMNIDFTVTPRAGDVVIYMRKSDGTEPTGDIKLNVLIMNNS